MRVRFARLAVVGVLGCMIPGCAFFGDQYWTGYGSRYLTNNLSSAQLYIFPFAFGVYVGSDLFALPVAAVHDSYLFFSGLGGDDKTEIAPQPGAEPVSSAETASPGAAENANPAVTPPKAAPQPNVAEKKRSSGVAEYFDPRPEGIAPGYPNPESEPSRPNPNSGGITPGHPASQPAPASKNPDIIITGPFGEAPSSGDASPKPQAQPGPTPRETPAENKPGNRAD